MRDIVRSTVIAAAAAGLTLSAAAWGDNAFAQTKQPPTASEASTPAERPIKQIALTAQQQATIVGA